MLNADYTISRLIAAGAVTVKGTEPVFTGAFLDYFTAVLAKSPTKEESSNGWREILRGFNSSLGSLETHQLGIVVALLSYHMAIAEVPILSEKAKE